MSRQGKIPKDGLGTTRTAARELNPLRNVCQLRSTPAASGVAHDPAAVPSDDETKQKERESEADFNPKRPNRNVTESNRDEAKHECKTESRIQVGHERSQGLHNPFAAFVKTGLCDRWCDLHGREIENPIPHSGQQPLEMTSGVCLFRMTEQ